MLSNTRLVLGGSSKRVSLALTSCWFEKRHWRFVTVCVCMLVDLNYLGQNGGNLGGDKAGFFPFTGPRWTRYGQSKLANVAFMLALHNRIAALGLVNSNCLCIVQLLNY